jgi:hypothetical protein
LVTSPRSTSRSTSASNSTTSAVTLKRADRSGGSAGSRPVLAEIGPTATFPRYREDDSQSGARAHG